MVELNLEFITKVLPPRPKPDILRRQRLLDFLHEHVNLKLQIVAAPAGYGKSTLLSDFAADSDVPVCWYSLDETDHDPRVFFETLLTSLRYRFPEFGKKTEARLMASADCVREASQIIGLLAGEMFSDIPDFFAIVLDDYHVVESDGTINFLLDTLIERAPDNCHFIISGRSSVELPVLAKLQMKREMATLPLSELSFTADEVKQWLQKNHKLEISDEEMRKLAGAVEGWIAGVLVGISKLRGGTPGYKADLSIDAVFAYLASEVYEQQPPDIKGFLLLSSTFKEIAPEYCDLLFKLKNSRQLLDRVEKRNLFISRLEGRRNLYRYHSLFRDFLQQKLQHDQPDTYVLLHRDAGSIMEEQKQWNQAVEHYAAAGAYPNIVRIIKTIGESNLKAGRWQTLSRWIQALPEETRIADPTVALFEAQALIHLGQPDRAVQILNELFRAVNTRQDWLALAKTLSWRSAAFRLTGHFDKALEDIKKCIAILKENSGPAGALGEAYFRLGTIHAEQGRLGEAEKCLKRSLKLLVAVFDANQIAAAHNSLGIVFKRQGDMVHAMTHYKQARQYWERANNEGGAALALNNMGVIYRRFGQYDMAIDTLKVALDRARSSGYRRTEGWVLINIADVKRDLGLFKDALQTYAEVVELGGQLLESSQVTTATAGVGECYRLLGKLDKAEMSLNEALAEAEGRHQNYDAGLFGLQLGIVRCLQGQSVQAEHLLRSVYDQMGSFGDKEAQAKCALHLAQLSYSAGRYASATKWLRELSGLVDALGYNAFLVVEGRAEQALLQYAAFKGIGNGLYGLVLKQIAEGTMLSGKVSEALTEPARQGEALPCVDAQALGVTAVKVNSRPVEDSQWRSTKAKEMFFYLLSRNGRAAKDDILASVWPDASPAKGTSIFHSSLYRLRRALFDSVILNQGGSYTINPAVEVHFDAEEFECLFSEADKLRLTDDERIFRLEKAVGIYKGPFLKDVYSDWVDSRRRELEEQYLKALGSLAGFYERCDRRREAIDVLEKSIAVDPYFDGTYYDLAKCYLTIGDRASALRVCQRYASIVEEERGTTSSRMAELARSIRSERIAAP